MTRKNKFLFALVVAILVSVSAFIFIRQKLNMDPSLTTVTARLLWLHQAQFAGVYAAQEEGFFKKRGLEVAIVPGGPGINPVRMIISGSEDIGICSGTDIVVARDKGIPVRCLAVVVRENPICLFSKVDSGIRTVGDFRGKKIGIIIGLSTEYCLSAMLKHAGVGEAEIERIPIRYDLSPFFRGDVDVWCGYRLNEPNIARAHGYEVTEILPADYGVSVVGDVLFASEAFYRRHPEVCWSFVEATWEGWEFARDHPAQALRHTMTFNPKGNPRHEEAMLRTILPLIFVEGQTDFFDQDKQTWARMIAFLKDSGVIKKSIPPSSCFWMRK